MANERHLKLLERGKEDWDSFRAKNPTDRSTLDRAAPSRMDLAGADLSSWNLEGFNLSRTDLTGTKLVGTNLRNAELGGAILNSADLTDAQLSNAILRGTALRNALLRGGKCERANFLQSDLSWADLSGADLRGANLSEAECRRANFSSADLQGVLLSKCDMSDANLTDVRGISCSDLKQCVSWYTAFRSEELACGREIPNRTGLERTFEAAAATAESQTQANRILASGAMFGSLDESVIRVLATAEISDSVWSNLVEELNLGDRTIARILASAELDRRDKQREWDRRQREQEKELEIRQAAIRDQRQRGLFALVIAILVAIGGWVVAFLT